jgi:hypothetical protein
MSGLLISQGETVTSEAKFDRIAQGRTAEDFDLRAVAEAHLQETTAKFGIAAYADDVAAAADAKLVEPAGLRIGTLVAGVKSAWR